VPQRMSDVEVSRRQLRIFLANRAIALGWTLKGSCKPCAHGLFTTARWLVPEAQRFLVHRTGSQHRYRRIFEFAVDLGSLLSRIQPHVVVGFLIVLGFVGLLHLAMQIGTQPVVENSALGHDPQLPSETMALVSETGSLPTAQITPVPLPVRKPEKVYKVPNGKRSNAVTHKRIAQQKTARPKPVR
jgi:hypothetical protein